MNKQKQPKEKQNTHQILELAQNWKRNKTRQSERMKGKRWNSKQDDHQQRDERWKQKLHLAYEPNCLFVVFTTIVVDQI